MSEATIFCLGVVFGAIICGALLVLYGQWLFASGAVFRTDELTDDEARIVAEEKLRELSERAIALTRWPTRPA